MSDADSLLHLALDVSRSLQTVAAPSVDRRSARLPDGRGYRSLWRLLRGDEGDARRVRRRTHQGHAAGRKRHCWRGRWRGDGGHEAHRRGHDLQLQPSRARPDRQQRGHDSAYVRRAVRGSADYPHGDRRRTARRRPTFAFSRRMVRAHPWASHPDAGDDRRRALHASRRAPGSQPDADFRACHALQYRGRSRFQHPSRRYRSRED